MSKQDPLPMIGLMKKIRTMKVVDDTTELIVGKMYDVKCAVVMNRNTFIGHVPIIGDKHKDPQFGVNFHHYHIDGRFFNENKAARVDRDGKTNLILQADHEPNRNYVTEIVIKRKKCIRLTTGVNPPDASRDGRYDNWYKSMVGKSCAGKKCPHLGAMMKEENGKLVCPLHGLKGCIEKEVIINR